MFYDVISASEYVSQILQGASLGTVHSVYRSTANLSLGSHLIALQVFGSPLSPISLIIERKSPEFQELGITLGQSVKIAPNAIQIGTHLFSYADACTEDLRLTTTVGEASVRILAEHIKNAILSADTGGFRDILHSQAHPKSTVDEFARRYMDECTVSLKSGKFEQAAGQLCRLIGLGTGLTPSGDDFLCGVLAGLTLIGKSHDPFTVNLRNHISSLLGNTNDISAAFLGCALDGQYSQAVNNLAKVPSTSEIAASFRMIGHSSGIDTLCGVLYVLESALNVNFVN